MLQDIEGHHHLESRLAKGEPTAIALDKGHCHLQWWREIEREARRVAKMRQELPVGSADFQEAPVPWVHAQQLRHLGSVVATGTDMPAP